MSLVKQQRGRTLGSGLLCLCAGVHRSERAAKIVLLSPRMTECFHISDTDTEPKTCPDRNSYFALV
jgi:hypothetical protein